MAKKKKKDDLLAYKVVFGIMLGIVLILIIALIKLSVEQKQRGNVQLIIPILSDKINEEFNIDISNLKENETKTYVFKVTNYRDKEINKENIDYSLSLNKLGNDVDISMYKNQEKDNLLIKDDFKVMGTLFKEQKMEYTYTIKIKANKKVENKKKISISINTIN